MALAPSAVTLYPGYRHGPENQVEDRHHKYYVKTYGKPFKLFQLDHYVPVNGHAMAIIRENGKKRDALVQVQYTGGVSPPDFNFWAKWNPYRAMIKLPGNQTVNATSELGTIGFRYKLHNDISAKFNWRYCSFGELSQLTDTKGDDIRYMGG